MPSSWAVALSKQVRNFNVGFWKKFAQPCPDNARSSDRGVETGKAEWAGVTEASLRQGPPRFICPLHPVLHYWRENGGIMSTVATSGREIAPAIRKTPRLTAKLVVSAAILA